MADSSFGLKIGLEDEREFKRAITDINREMRVLGSEMKLAASAFAKNETSVGSLTAKNQVLAKEIDAQRQKVDTLRAALDNAASSFGENDSRTKNWQIQLNNAQAMLNGLEAELEDNNDALKQFGSHTDDAGDEAKDAAGQAGKLEEAVDDLGSEIDDTSGKTRVFGDVLKANLASEAIVAGVKGIASAVAGVAKGFAGAMKDGVEYNARMEQYTTSFTTMLGDQAKAQQLVNDLKREAARTPFGMEDLAKNTQTLMAFGMSAEEAQLRLGQLGDISQGDAVKLESLTLAFAQMSSTGKLTGQDLNQMINAGFNPLEEISRKTGKSIGELKEEMAKGAISAEMVADAFASATAEGGRFYGAMDAQSQNQDEYRERFNQLEQRQREAINAYEATQSEIKRRHGIKAKLTRFKKTLQKATLEQDFDQATLRALCQRIEVTPSGETAVIFADSTKIEISAESY